MKKLLIIGAGGHGKVTAEIAEALGVYETVDFADDNSPNAVGSITELERLHKLYDCAFASNVGSRTGKKSASFNKS